MRATGFSVITVVSYPLEIKFIIIIIIITIITITIITPGLQSAVRNLRFTQTTSLTFITSVYIHWKEATVCI